MSKDLENEKTFTPIDRLPDDITTNILTRLPIKSIYCCRAVRKHWRSIIDQPTFSIVHFNTSVTQTTTHSSSFIVLPVGTKRNLHIFEGQNPNPKPLNVTLDFHGTDESESESRLYLVGSCYGLICLSTWCQSVSFDPDESSAPASTAPRCLVYICNPTTGEVLKLPDITPLNFQRVYVTYGFGFDPLAKEFKVVMIFQIECTNGEPLETEVQLFTLGSSSWRKLIHPAYVRVIMGEGSGVFLNGSIHWLLTRDEHYSGIASFRVGSETFGAISAPAYLDLEGFASIPKSLTGGVYISSCDLSRLGVVRGCLCFTYLHSFGQPFQIWIMNDYNVKGSWIKQFDVDTKPICKLHSGCLLSIGLYLVTYNAIQPVCFRENGELVLLCNNKFLASYNHETGAATPILVQDESLETTFQALPYVRSLISPKLACRIKRNNLEETNA